MARKKPAQPEANVIDRLRGAVKRLGLKGTVELLKESQLSEFESLSEPTLSRWQSGRTDEEFPRRAELAVRLLESGALTSGARTMRYGVIPNPASIPLVFLRPLVRELAGSALNDESQAEPLRAITDPNSTTPSLRVGLRLTLQRKSLSDATTDDALGALVEEDGIDLTVAPEITFEKDIHPVSEEDPDERAPIKVCRLAHAPTIVLRQRSGDPVKVHKVCIFFDGNRRNSKVQAEHFCTRLKHAGVMSEGQAEPVLDSDDLIRAIKAANEQAPDEHRPFIYAFGQTRFLWSVYRYFQSPGAETRRPVEPRADQPFRPRNLHPDSIRFDINPAQFGTTNWCIYIRRSAFDVGHIAVLLQALRIAVDRVNTDKAFDWLQKHPDDLERETGLGDIRSFTAVCKVEKHPYIYRCDDLGIQVIDALLAAALRI